ncbi:MAG: InlB B-repeat-containing protein [Bacilli bacterium]|nr:InlB B-repeat-containing protein [Bacilli bacterium]
MKFIKLGRIVLLSSLVFLFGCSESSPEPEPEPQPTKTYTVEFDANGGTPVPATQTVKKYQQVKKPKNPEKENARFDYWSKKGRDTPYNFSNLVLGDMTLVANYTNIYTVSFETFGKTDPIPNQIVAENGYATRPEFDVPIGTSFENWYYSSPIGGLEVFDFENTPINKNITLYAKFEDTCIVSFETNGGTKIPPIQVLKNHTIDKPEDPKKGIAIFEGWYKDKELQEEYEFGTLVTGSMTLYAKWTEVWMVELYAPGASPYHQLKKVNDGEYVTNVATPTMSGYEFTGWHRSQIFPVDDPAVDLETTPIKENMFLFAGWDKDIPKCTVTFKYNNGAPDVTEKVILGDYVDQPEDPTKKNYYFDSWYINVADGSQEVFDFDTPITEDITLYAEYGKEQVVLESSESLEFKNPTYSGDTFKVDVSLANGVDANYYYIPKSIVYYDITTSNGKAYTNCSLDSSSYTITIDLKNQKSVVHIKANEAICKYLSFTAAADDSWVSFDPEVLQRGGGKLEYNTQLSEEGWQSWEGGRGESPGKLRIPNGETRYIRGTNDKLGGDSNNLYFIMNGRIKADGDITCLRNYSTKKRSYQGLFSGTAELLTAPQLPLTELSDYSYLGMFDGCTNLLEAPALPATSIGNATYSEMFSSCASIKKAPLLLAQNVKRSSYGNMFSGCHSLVKAPQLIAKTLDDGSSYARMFLNCTSLVHMPDIQATKLSTLACDAMFEGCTSLRFAKALPATTLADQCYSNMFNKCTSLLVAPKLPAANNQLVKGCYQFMFMGCTNLRSIEVGFDEYGFSQDEDGRYIYTSSWCEDVKAVGAFDWKGSTTYDNRNKSTILEGWAINHID